MDHGPEPYVVDKKQMAAKNQNFRTAIWTGKHLQMTLMSIPVCGEIGAEMHPKTDQLLQVEQGNAIVKMGNSREELCCHQVVCEGDAIFVPAGTWHNVINMGRNSLKLSSVYAAPNHARGTVHRTKEEAEKEEY